MKMDKKNMRLPEFCPNKHKIIVRNVSFGVLCVCCREGDTRGWWSVETVGLGVCGGTGGGDIGSRGGVWSSVLWRGGVRLVGL